MSKVDVVYTLSSVLFPFLQEKLHLIVAKVYLLTMTSPIKKTSSFTDFGGERLGWILISSWL